MDILKNAKRLGHPLPEKACASRKKNFTVGQEGFQSGQALSQLLAILMTDLSLL
jgi:hypothetical protein